MAPMIRRMDSYPSMIKGIGFSLRQPHWIQTSNELERSMMVPMGARTRAGSAAPTTTMAMRRISVGELIAPMYLSR